MVEAEARYPTADRHEAELRISAELERLPGVITAAAWLADSTRLRDVRLHILPGATPTIVSNAASGVLRSLGIAFDAGTIRITTVVLPDTIELPAPPEGGSNRMLLLHDLTLSRSGSHVACRIELMRRGTIATGEAHELDTATGRVRATATATLRAAEHAFESLALGLEGASIISLFGRSYGIVSVEAAIGRTSATLSGIVAVDNGRAAEEAVCLATLRAIERWLSGVVTT
jgi:hypothetical protein